MVSPSELPGITDVADLVVAQASRRGPTLGEARLICVDGPAGSGKTTLARALGELTAGPVIHMDDLYEGWTGMDALARQLPRILGPLSQGEPGEYRRYDWIVGRYAETVAVPVGPWLILEGVGSGIRQHQAQCTLLVFVNAPPELRLRRGQDRDGAESLPYWRKWMLDEARMFTREGQARRADVLVDGTGRRPPVLSPQKCPPPR